jgi:hypothetical protein
MHIAPKCTHLQSSHPCGNAPFRRPARRPTTRAPPRIAASRARPKRVVPCVGFRPPKGIFRLIDRPFRRGSCAPTISPLSEPKIERAPSSSEHDVATLGVTSLSRPSPFPIGQAGSSEVELAPGFRRPRDGEAETCIRPRRYLAHEPEPTPLRIAGASPWIADDF